MQTRQINMQRWSITSQKPFDAVVAAVEGKIGRPNMGEFVAKMTAPKNYEEMQKVVHDSVSEIGLMEFMRLDHGAVLESRSRRKPEERAPDHGQSAHHAIDGSACPGCGVLCARDGADRSASGRCASEL